MNNHHSNRPTDVYTIVTNRIIEHLEKGVVPWRQPWADAGLPKNLVSGKTYRGINVWLLSTLNYPQNCFLSFKQVKELGGTVKRGEKAQEVIFWKWLEVENKETKEKEKIPMLRYYNAKEFRLKKYQSKLKGIIIPLKPAKRLLMKCRNALISGIKSKGHFTIDWMIM